jgi:sugar O-acyltransferase (sialic acid O-acetyltransferase NeuD family)
MTGHNASMTERIMTEGLGIFGAGGFGREVAWLAQQAFGQEVALTFLVDRLPLAGSTVNGISVRDVEEFAHEAASAPVVVAIGDPRARQRCVETCELLGLTFAALIHPRAEVSRWVAVGRGSIICAGCVLTTNTEIGDHVHVNLDCTIGHDVEIGAFTTLAPGVHVSGRVKLGTRVYVGTGAVFINGSEDEPLIIGDDAVIGAAACVIRNVEPGALVVGVPAERKR